MNVTDFVRDNTNFANRNSNNLFRLNCSTDIRFSMIQRAAQKDEYFLQFLNALGPSGYLKTLQMLIHSSFWVAAQF